MSATPLSHAISDAASARIQELEREVAKWHMAFQVEKTANEEALAADRALERAMGRMEGEDERNELRHRLRWARGYLRQLGKSDPTYAMAAVIAGISETLKDDSADVHAERTD